MANVLKVIDVVDIGIEKEKARRDFYDRVSQHFEDEEMKTLFTRLRDWEEAHIKKFHLIRNTVESSPAVETYPGELESYMDALVDDMLYSQVSPESFSANVKTPIDAINYGIGFEKDAIMLFMELSGYVQSKDKEAIQELMGEERQHIVYLIKLRKKLAGS